MPPRWLALLIVVFWMGSSAWLFWRDLWPNLRPGEPPPYTVDLVEEAQRGKSKVYWTVTHNDLPAFAAETWVEHNPNDDTFTLWEEFHPKALRQDGPVRGLLQIVAMKSQCRVSREGNLLSLQAAFTAKLTRQIADFQGEIQASFAGEVRDGQFRPHYTVTSTSPLFSGRSLKGKLAAVDVSRRGAVLLPLHPVNRMVGLRRGQTWRVPEVNLFALTTTAFFGEGMHYLQARVLPEPQPVRYGTQDVPCLVVEYQGEDMTAHTYVEEKTGLVLKQELTQDHDRWALVREK